MCYSKKDQLKKNKKANPRKMTKKELEAYKFYVYESQNGLCFCGCGNPITEYHHAYFGIHKDDRSIVGIAQHPCHYAIHHGSDIKEKRRLVSLSVEFSKDMWLGYSGEEI